MACFPVARGPASLVQPPVFVFVRQVSGFVVVPTEHYFRLSVFLVIAVKMNFHAVQSVGKIFADKYPEKGAGRPSVGIIGGVIHYMLPFGLVNDVSTTFRPLEIGIDFPQSLVDRLIEFVNKFKRFHRVLPAASICRSFSVELIGLGKNFIRNIVFQREFRKTVVAFGFQILYQVCHNKAVRMSKAGQ